MIQAFYQTRPERDTPYRELELKHDKEEGWHVLLLGGAMWGASVKTLLSDVPAKDFDQGKTVYDNLFRQLQDYGWKPYVPHEWE